MTKKLRMALVVALAVAGGGWGAASADSAENCERNGNNASGCDFDGDLIPNKEDPDDDDDGIVDEDEVDGCGRNDDTSCGEPDEGGGEPTPAPDVEGLIAQVVAAVEDAADQLPPPPGGDLPPLPGDVPPLPGDAPPLPGDVPPAPDAAGIIAEAVATVEGTVAEVVGQLPPAPAPEVPPLP